VSAGVDAALAALPERQRAALWLAAVDGQSYAEVAMALDTSEPAVKALVHRARTALAEALTGLGAATIDTAWEAAR
jgi:RNA polymerase sigma-70 factor (ECF subfamily)